MSTEPKIIMASDVSLTTASRSQWRPNGLVKLQGYGTTEHELDVDTLMLCVNV